MVNRVVPLAELRTASLRYAKRLSLISPEALYATKRAVNRGADAAGFRVFMPGSTLSARFTRPRRNWGKSSAKWSPPKASRPR